MLMMVESVCLDKMTILIELQRESSFDLDGELIES